MQRADSHDLSVRLYAALVGLSFGLGAVILSGGPRRFSAPSFDGPKYLVEYLPLLAPHTYWGLLFMFHGIALIVTLGRTLAIHVLRFGIVVYMFLALSFVVSVVWSPFAALTGVVAYLTFAAVCLILSDHLSVHGWGT